MAELIENSPLVHGYLHEFMKNCQATECAQTVGSLAVANGLCLKPFDFIRLVVVASDEEHDPDEHLVATFPRDDHEDHSIGTVTRVASNGDIRLLPDSIWPPGLSLEHTFLLAACLRAAVPAKVPPEKAATLLDRILSYVEATETGS